VGLPDLNGFELFKRLQALPGGARVPMLFLTARSDEIDRVVGLELGADDYIAKPFSPRELVARVRTILRRSGRPRR
jgi:two-component system catabolic regulation response regulator CreB